MSRLPRVREVFDRAVELDAGERAAYLDRVCREDTRLREEVEGLLAADSAAGSFLAGVTVGDTWSGYRLLERIGEGGFGVVFRAEQLEPLRRAVALKVLKPGIGLEGVVARFEAERQALARMDHPGIARVFDAGTAPTGQPFFVMELVAGESITAFCERTGAGLRQRVELFRDVCLAVQHAHHKGVVHRDLKPSNILVTEVDGAPVPKVIDFGIAKAIGEDGIAPDGRTGANQLLGTPAYMSPEQARAGRADVDTRSDVYSLGVVLYELLAGVPVVDPERLRDSDILEVCRIIAEEEPQRPSTRSSSLWTSGDPPALTLPAEVLAGELDWIAMKALEKDPARRYDSPAALARDLERYLGDLPVDAGPPSALYRTRKFLRRHVKTVVAVAAVFVSLLAGTVVSATIAVREARQRELAESARAAEAFERERAEQVAAFAQDMLVGIDPRIAGDLDKALMRLVLDRASRRVESELGDDPRIAAALHATIAESYERTVGDIEVAERHARRAVELLTPFAATAEDRFLGARQVLASVLTASGRLDEAEAVHQESLEARRRAFGDEHPETLASISGLAQVAAARGDYERAAELFARVLEGRRRVLGDEHRATLGAARYHAQMLDMLGRHAEAVERCRAVWETSCEHLGDEDPDSLSALGELVGALGSAGRSAEAEPLARRLVETTARLWGEEHALTARALSSLALILRRTDDLAEAESTAARAVEIRERAYGADHLRTSSARTLHGTILAQQRRFDEAERVLRAALAAYEATAQLEHPDALTCRSELGSVLMRQRRYDEAEPLLRAAIDGKRKERGEDHPSTLASMALLASLLDRDDRSEAALEIYDAVLEAQRRVLGAEHPRTLRTLLNIASVLLRVGDFERGAEIARELVEVHGRIHGPDDRSTLRALRVLATHLGHQGRRDEALEQLGDLLERHRRRDGPDHADTLTTENNLGVQLWLAGRYDEAQRLLGHCHAARLGSLGAEHPSSLFTAVNYACALTAGGRHREAEEVARAALEAGAEGGYRLALLGPLGAALYATRRYEEADEVLSEAVAERRIRAPGSAVWPFADELSLLAACKLEHGERDAAAALLDEADRVWARDSDPSPHVATLRANHEATKARLGAGDPPPDTR